MVYIGDQQVCGATLDNDDGYHEHVCTDHDQASTLSHHCQCGYRWYHTMADATITCTSDL